MVSSVKGALSTKSVDAEKIVGTWLYVKPVVISASGNMLSDLATGSIARKVENQLNKYLERVHASADNIYFKILKNGTYSYAFVGEKFSGHGHFDTPPGDPGAWWHFRQ